MSVPELLERVQPRVFPRILCGAARKLSQPQSRRSAQCSVLLTAGAAGRTELPHQRPQPPGAESARCSRALAASCTTMQTRAARSPPSAACSLSPRWRVRLWYLWLLVGACLAIYQLATSIIFVDHLATQYSVVYFEAQYENTAACTANENIAIQEAATAAGCPYSSIGYAPPIGHWINCAEDVTTDDNTNGPSFVCSCECSVGLQFWLAFVLATTGVVAGGAACLFPSQMSAASELLARCASLGMVEAKSQGCRVERGQLLRPHRMPLLSLMVLLQQPGEILRELKDPDFERSLRLYDVTVLAVRDVPMLLAQYYYLYPQGPLPPSGLPSLKATLAMGGTVAVLAYTVPPLALRLVWAWLCRIASAPAAIAGHGARLLSEVDAEAAAPPAGRDSPPSSIMIPIWME